MRGNRDLHHALFYCAPGQIDEVVPILGDGFGLRVSRFTAEESAGERGRLLEDFADNRLQGLVAMRCLDEGVDVPSTQVAYILASTSNPREFIQRRGRILRKSPGKEHAVIHDLVALPSLDSSETGSSDSSFAMERVSRVNYICRLASISFAGSPPWPGPVAGQHWSGSWGRQTPG